MRKNGSFYIESLGCAKNQVDSELMIAALQKAGWKLSQSPDDAEVLIVNTCGFISSAKKESIETTLALRGRFRGKKIYMVGCLPVRYGDELAKELPELDGFRGTGDPEGIAGMVCGRPERKAGSPLMRTRLLSFPGSAYVKVAEGCNNRCAYCAIPIIRGPLKSRPRDELLPEIRSLFSRGIREIILIAQDLGSYGMDLPREGKATPLSLLLRDIARLSGEFWVRLLYIHPDRFPRDILPHFSSDPRFLPYFDIPIQHGSPGILEAMGRGNDPRRNLDLIGELRGRLRRAVIRSTFLVGFPGETDEDFALLRGFQEKAALDWLGVFTYSREEDTPAYRMKGRVPMRIAAQRKALVEKAQLPITERALDARVGMTCDVLVEEQVKGFSIARSYLQAPDVDGLTVVRGTHEPGSLVRVRVIKRNGLDLEAEVNG
jgi:ribosomal protein S12 methylthiotransferase